MARSAAARLVPTAAVTTMKTRVRLPRPRWASLVSLIVAVVARLAWEDTLFVAAGWPSRTPATSRVLALAATGNAGSPGQAKARAFQEGQLTNDITKSSDADAVLSLLENNLDTPLFGHIHLAAAFTTLAKLQRTMSKETRQHGQIEALVQVAREQLQSGRVPARSVANIFWAVAKLHRALPQTCSLEPALLKAVESRAIDFKPQELSNMIWAAATLRNAAPQLLTSIPLLAQKAAGCADRFIPQHLANIIWSAATLRTAVPELLAILPVLQVVAMEKMESFDSQNVANAWWSTAVLRSLAPSLQSLLPALIDRAHEVGPDMRGQELANTIWAAATLRDHHSEFAELLPELLTLAARRRMNAQEMANVIWGAGQLNFNLNLIKSPACRTALERLLAKATAHMNSFKGQELGNLCWGAALCSLVDKKFMLAVARRTRRMAPKADPTTADMNLPQIVWAFAKLGFRARKMLAAVSERVSEVLPQMNKWGLCALAWSYDELDDDDSFLAFRRRVREIAAGRGFSDERIELSQLGPQAWRRRYRTRASKLRSAR